MPLTTYHQTKLALGCDTTLVLVSDNSQVAIEQIFNKIWLNIFEFENRFSRFLPSSELSLFNRNAGLKTPISQEFKEILTKAKDMALKTNNLFNPFILPALQRAGYAKSFVDEYKLDQADDHSEKAVSSPDKILISDTFAQIPANTAIDLGGIGKGYIADQVARLPELKGLNGYWFSFGGDIVGSGYDEQDNPWRVSIQDAHAPEKMLKNNYQPADNNFHIASSGIITRKFGKSGQKMQHHIIDPNTRKPAKTDILLATVEAASTCEADVYASCAVILGSAKASQFLIMHGIKSFLLQPQSKSAKFISEGNLKEAYL